MIFYFNFFFVYEKTDEQTFVLIKILKSDVLRKKVKSKIREACYVFSDEEQIKQIYLNTSWKTSIKSLNLKNF